jgi:hypothetical protein
MATEPVKTLHTEPVKEKAVVAGPKVAHPFVNKIPDGAMDPNDVVPGYAPNQGSPKEGDPTRLQNPENPNSPVTVPSNPSNPANMPQTQSEKPASEQRIFNEMQTKANPKAETPEAKKAKEDKAALLKQIGDILAKYNNNESDIPATNEYWSLVGKYRGM